jgi:hypothetical protein
VDIPEFLDRCENGNRFKVGAEMTGKIYFEEFLVVSAENF